VRLRSGISPDNVSAALGDQVNSTVCSSVVKLSRASPFSSGYVAQSISPKILEILFFVFPIDQAY
jgi:hypothetical protein